MAAGGSCAPVAVLEGAGARLLEAGTGAVAAVSLPHLVTDPGFEVVGADRPMVAPLALLDALPDQVRDQALAWERHVREVESGVADPRGGAPRPQYDPATRTMAQREAAKAAELTGAGLVSTGQPDRAGSGGREAEHHITTSPMFSQVIAVSGIWRRKFRALCRVLAIS
ncbi:hypothetical protein ACIBJD_38090 [Kitasatospora sp. NPDC050467]